jgi:hypothetical protein
MAEAKTKITIWTILGILILAIFGIGIVKMALTGYELTKKERPTPMPAGVIAW